MLLLTKEWTTHWNNGELIGVGLAAPMKGGAQIVSWL